MGTLTLVNTSYGGIASHRLDDLDNVLSDVANRLGDSNLDKVKKMEEYVFVGIFLPIFLGDMQESHGATLLTWVNYAGGYYNPVDIVNKNNQILFRVPAIYDRTIVRVDVEKTHSIANIMSMAKKYNGLSPVQGIAYGTRELGKVIDTMGNHAAIMPNLKLWNDIFTHYGRGIDMKVKNNVGAISNDTTSASNNDELIYD